MKKNMMRVVNETVWTIAPLDRKEDDNELSESTTRIIMESGFPEHWIVIEENAYGKLKTQRLNKKQLEKRFGVLPPPPQVPLAQNSKKEKTVPLHEVLRMMAK